MSYTLKPAGEEAREDAAAARVTQPVSVPRVGMGVAVGAVIMVSLAGIPSWTRERTPRPATDGLYHGPLLRQMACSEALSTLFADVSVYRVQDPPERPAYPTSEEVFARLLAIPVWQRAVLFVGDVALDELLAVGFSEEQCWHQLHAVHTWPTDPVARTFTFWKLVLLDEAGELAGSTILSLPTVKAQRLDWPRVTVFKRPLAVSPSDG